MFSFPEVPPAELRFRHNGPLDWSRFQGRNAALVQVAPDFIRLPEGFELAEVAAWTPGLGDRYRTYQILIGSEGRIVSTLRVTVRDGSVADSLVVETVPRFRGRGLQSAAIESLTRLPGAQLREVTVFFEHENAAQLAAAIERGLTPEKSAAATPTGRALESAGFRVRRALPGGAFLFAR